MIIIFNMEFGDAHTRGQPKQDEIMTSDIITYYRIEAISVKS